MPARRREFRSFVAARVDEIQAVPESDSGAGRPSSRSAEANKSDVERGISSPEWYRGWTEPGATAFCALCRSTGHAVAANTRMTAETRPVSTSLPPIGRTLARILDGSTGDHGPSRLSLSTNCNPKPVDSTDRPWESNCWFNSCRSTPFIRIAAFDANNDPAASGTRRALPAGTVAASSVVMKRSISPMSPGSDTRCASRARGGFDARRRDGLGIAASGVAAVGTGAG